MSVKRLVLSCCILEIDSYPLENDSGNVGSGKRACNKTFFVSVWPQSVISSELIVLQRRAAVGQCWTWKISSRKLPVFLAETLTAFASCPLQMVATLAAFSDCCLLLSALQTYAMPCLLLLLGRAYCSGFTPSRLYKLPHRPGGLRLGGAAGNVSSK